LLFWYKKVRTTTKKKGKEKKKPQAPSNEQKISQQKTLKIPITPKQKNMPPNAV
jgi:hypothetical protein